MGEVKENEYPKRYLIAIFTMRDSIVVNAKPATREIGIRSD